MRKAWEIFLKENGQQSYSSNEVGDFRYIAEDLTPHFFICDGETVDLEWEHFENVILRSDILQKVPFVSIGKELDKFKSLNHLKHYNKPFHLMSVYEDIISRVEES